MDRGADFTKLWTASAVSNIGDGVTLAAGPLLVASVSDQPAVIAGAAFAQQLPWLLFALVSGAYVDRLDRRRLNVKMSAVDVHGASRLRRATSDSRRSVRADLPLPL